MSNFYEIDKTASGYAVTMTACRRIMEVFPTESEANAALVLYDNGSRIADKRPKVRIVAEFVEEYDSGMQLGEVAQIDLRQYEVIGEVSQQDYDEEMEEFFRQNGHYPDQ